MGEVNKLKQAGAITGIILISALFLNYGSRWLYRLAYHMYPLYKSIDPDDAFMYLNLHHIFQGGVFLLMIGIAAKLFHCKWSDFGFNLNRYRFSLIYTVCFVAVWTVIQFGVGYLMVRSGTVFNMNFPLNSRNFTGYFLFELLLSGTSEELFFRVFIITVIISLMKNSLKHQKNIEMIAIIISTVLFMAGHIGYDLFPFRITYINGLQQLTVVIFSFAYGIVFLKTRSILGPMLMHNLLNVVATISTLVFTKMTH